MVNQMGAPKTANITIVVTNVLVALGGWNCRAQAGWAHAMQVESRAGLHTLPRWS